MNAEKDLSVLLRNLSPVLADEEYVFISADGEYGDFARLEPICTFREEEGLSLIVPRRKAIESGHECSTAFRRITLLVNSSLDAVGLTAAVSKALADAGISANVVAACLHDHVFVPSNRAEDALDLLRLLGEPL